MEVTGRGERLACGAELGQLVDQVAEATPPADLAHQAACPHCRAALEELESVWGEVRDLARQPVAVPAGVVEAVMRRVRAEHAAESVVIPLETIVPRLVRHALLTGERGTTQIADSVVAAVVRRAAVRVAGVHSVGAAGGLDAVVGRLAGQAGVEVEVEGHRVTAALAIVVLYGYAIPEVVKAVRERVVEAVEQIAGLEAAAIDITVVDVDG